MKYNILIVGLFLCCLGNAQQLTGIILDAETREPLPFANIVVHEQGRGTVSNIEGFYVLNMQGLEAEDTLLFSYIGYETLKVKAEDLIGKTEVLLKPAVINLKEIQVSSKTLTIHQILDLVKENYEKNHPVIAQKQNIFFHKYEKTPFPEENRLLLKKSNFIGLDKKTFDELFDLIPNEFVEYQDVRVALYSNGNKHKMFPKEGISLEEGSMERIGKVIEEKLNDMFVDINKSRKEEDIYYKFRTGILGYKFEKNNVNDTLWNAYKNDTLNYHIETNEVKNQILFLFRDYGNIESKNWEFINKKGKYNYKMEDYTIFNDELVYEISFTPKKSGLFEGRMYIAMDSYAVLQLDFAFADGKQSEKIQMFGFGHAMNFKKGRVIFEKSKSGYYIKYIYAQQKEFGSIDRQFSIMKKKKRFLLDKELTEIKIDAELAFNFNSYWEILVMDRKEIQVQQFEKMKQPAIMSFKKQFAYTTDVWNQSTVIAPSAELKKYKRQ